MRHEEGKRFPGMILVLDAKMLHLLVEEREVRLRVPGLNARNCVIKQFELFQNTAMLGPGDVWLGFLL
jgi:hypothetical protein